MKLNYNLELIKQVDGYSIYRNPDLEIKENIIKYSINAISQGETDETEILNEINKKYSAQDVMNKFVMPVRDRGSVYHEYSSRWNNDSYNSLVNLKTETWEYRYNEFNYSYKIDYEIAYTSSFLHFTLEGDIANRDYNFNLNPPEMVWEEFLEKQKPSDRQMYIDMRKEPRPIDSKEEAIEEICNFFSKYDKILKQDNLWFSHDFCYEMPDKIENVEFGDKLYIDMYPKVRKNIYYKPSESRYGKKLIKSKAIEVSGEEFSREIREMVLNYFKMKEDLSKNNTI